MGIRKALSDALEKYAEDVIDKTGCLGSWGEVELPECLRNADDEVVVEK